IKAGIQKAADAIRKGEQEVDLGEVIKLLKLDATKESDFFTQPNKNQSGIIYAATRKEVDRLYHLLKKFDFSVGRYHGGLNENER
ncbi:hypothetical protein, partial [Enterococcus faecium]|uniref:hypothetical protein n=1 Tax=Enterococcus faecium TaxID=1352 RepID=UPI0029306989